MAAQLSDEIPGTTWLGLVQIATEIARASMSAIVLLEPLPRVIAQVGTGDAIAPAAAAIAARTSTIDGDVIALPIDDCGALVVCGATPTANVATLEALAHQAATLLSLAASRRNAEVARRAQMAQRARLEAFFDAAAVGIYAVGLSPHDYGNPALERILGMPAGELARRWRSTIVPGDDEVLRRLAEETGDRAPPPVEYRVVRDDGSIVHVRNHLAPVRSLSDPQGPAIGWIGTIVDITESRLAEISLRETATQLERAEASADIGNWRYTMATGRVTWSRNMFRLLQRDPALGVPQWGAHDHHVLPTDRAPLHEAIRVAVEAGEPWSHVYRAHLPNGAIRYFQTRGQMRVDDDGLQQCEGSDQDVTAQVHAREALEKAKHQAEAAARAKADFLATMSHEIRTPLNGVLGMAELLQGTDLTAEQRHYVEVARSSGAWLRDLVSDVLDFSKIEAEHVTLDPRPFDLRALLDDVASVVSQSARHKGIGLHVDVLAGAPQRLVGDARRLRQILLNLLANAVKFTERGRVVLAAAGHVVRDDDDPICRLELSVDDTGPGIEPELIAHVFEPFVQGARVISRRQGTGLGLAIAQRLATLMDGSVSVTSKLGVGSRFVFALSLPIASSAAEVAPSLQAIIDDRTFDGIVVLVAEDNPVNAFLLKKLLSRLGCTVDVVDDGVAAVAAVRARTYDIVLMDCIMPKMDGYLAAAAIREAGLQVPIVAVTASAIDGDRERCIVAGMDDYLTKPISGEAIATALRRWL